MRSLPHIGQSGFESRKQGGQAAGNSGFFNVRQHAPSLGCGAGQLRLRRFLVPVFEPAPLPSHVSNHVRAA